MDVLVVLNCIMHTRAIIKHHRFFSFFSHSLQLSVCIRLCTCSCIYFTRSRKLASWALLDKNYVIYFFLHFFLFIQFEYMCGDNHVHEVVFLLLLFCLEHAPNLLTLIIFLNRNLAAKHFFLLLKKAINFYCYEYFYVAILSIFLFDS